ncbi:MAG: hypothetical protein A3A80_01495 [Candidatus Terrybacteria bacterium RIFCSPLOWO2_01_FULL_44_24]|uniref:Elongation factor P C-terminal domain-containing protein n=1 Tax=Candidatus Terrybacteria bacterium RIFCSPHIGHO2_01_FULL_43_35 TaxID=1802361 RepID=A0A1G2PFG3_9BACT|nr:MAG: hypothetical protein A2828_03870 [Candidatus Terrybacteria bacterium RIFCSPHIGHO2_01_FULL_43_35]OHA51753.1 MAG: hypothetical protein A3A80_01495 [Candidatus Terrybacteria bacterium RIFCSPLOWO2_01_FULL_44_24]
MLGHTDLTVGTVFVMDGDPWQVMETQFVKMAQRTGHVQAKIKNLRTGSMLSRAFKQADRFEEADLETIKSMFVFAHRGKYVFAEIANPKNRFEFTEEQVGDNKYYLKNNLEVGAMKFQGQFIGIIVPPKVDLKVTEAAPGVRGNSAQGGTKTVVCESGLELTTPLFIEEGDIIRVNTKTGEYVERAK